MTSAAGPPSRRTEIWRILRAATEPLSIADIAEQLSLHPNTVRFHLGNLVADGQAERVTPEHRSPGRPPLLFRTTTGMDPLGPRSYQFLAEVLVDALAGTSDVQRRATEAGRSWWHHEGAHVDSEIGPNPKNHLTRLGAVLDKLGFAPEVSKTAVRKPDGEYINLRHCPFLELTAQDPEVRTQVVCPIHLGLMQGALEEWNAPLIIDRLDPFVEPDLCVAHLRRSH